MINSLSNLDFITPRTALDGIGRPNSCQQARRCPEKSDDLIMGQDVDDIHAMVSVGRAGVLGGDANKRRRVNFK
jgi:hypothetical protein